MSLAHYLTDLEAVGGDIGVSESTHRALLRKNIYADENTSQNDFDISASDPWTMHRTLGKYRWVWCLENVTLYCAFSSRVFYLEVQVVPFMFVSILFSLPPPGGRKHSRRLQERSKQSISFSRRMHVMSMDVHGMPMPYNLQTTVTSPPTPQIICCINQQILLKRISLLPSSSFSQNRKQFNSLALAVHSTIVDDICLLMNRCIRYAYIFVHG